ncbi:MAG: CHAP domain-containing protein [Solirubrobacterales bacterium]
MGALTAIAVVALWLPSSAFASQTECLSYGYACTPGYDGANASGTWAWTHYGGIYAINANGYHNCTLYAAWRLEQNGMGDPGNWGNAAEWINHTSWNHTPAVGSIAWWGGGYGHVAYVEQIRGGEVFVRADNFAGENSDGYTDAGWISASSVGAFLHPHDLPSGPPAEGSFVSHGGFIYRIAGGAPIYVSNWAVVGGPQPSRALSDAEFAALPQYPRNGTILDSSAGGVYIAAGGAPLYLSNWAAIGGPKPGVGIDQAAIDNAGGGVPWDHLRAYPADGTFLNSSTGAVYRVAGGAPLYVSNWNIYGGVQPYVTVDSWDIDHAGSNPAAHLRAYPADGTLVSTSGDGRVYEIAGGAPLYVSNWNAIGGARPSTGIDQWDVNHPDNPAAHLREYPQDGTFILTSTGRVYRVAGGAPFYVSSWSVFGGVQPHVGVDQWDVDNTSDPHAHLRPSPLDGTIVQGLPSMQYWSFASGLRSPTTASPTATQVDDVGLAAFPQAATAAPVPSAGPGPHTRTCRRHRHKHSRHRHHRKGRLRHRACPEGGRSPRR